MRAKEYQGHGMFASCQHTDEELTKAKASLRERDERIAALENRHVQFMIEGGLVVMATEYDKLAAENAALRRQVEALSAPVTDAEWRELCTGDDMKWATVRREDIDALLAARKGAL